MVVSPCPCMRTLLTRILIKIPQYDLIRSTGQVISYSWSAAYDNSWQVYDRFYQAKEFCSSPLRKGGPRDSHKGLKKILENFQCPDLFALGV